MATKSGQARSENEGILQVDPSEGRESSPEELAKVIRDAMRSTGQQSAAHLVAALKLHQDEVASTIAALNVLVGLVEQPFADLRPVHAELQKLSRRLQSLPERTERLATFVRA